MARFGSGGSLPLRVNQLDAAELDNELVDILRSQFLGVFKYFKSFCIEKYHPEVTAAIRCALWKYSIGSNGATFGQSMLAMRYKDARPTAAASAAGAVPSLTQRRLFAFCTVVVPWLLERSQTAAAAFLPSDSYTKFVRAVQKLGQLWSVACLVNFLVFLHEGIYCHVLERLLRLQSIHPERQTLRQVSFDFTVREVLWNGFGEILMILLPVIDLRRLWRSIFARQSGGGGSRLRKEVESCAACAVCSLVPPTNAHQFSGCRHVYCYFCLESKFEEDGKVPCAACGGCMTSKHQMSLAAFGSSCGKSATPDRAVR